MADKIGQCPCCGSLADEWTAEEKELGQQELDRKEHEKEQNFRYIPESRSEAENTDWNGDYSVFDGDGEEY